MIAYRDVKDWPGYRVGDDGTVLSCRTSRGLIGDSWRLLCPLPDRDGYLSVVLCRNGVRRRCKVAHLVLEAFVGPAPAGCESAHWPNVDPADNRLVNLRWSTHAANIQDKLIGGTVARGVTHGSVKLTEQQVLAIRADHAAGCGGYKTLGRKYGVSSNQIKLIVKRLNWTHLEETCSPA